MITSILQESNSPTLQISRKENIKTIESFLWDDFERQFPIEITYSFTKRSGYGNWGILIDWFDFKLCPDACIHESDVNAICREIIKDEEAGITEFD